jgi:tetratricopeptide (TPR) repeat protein
VEKAISALQKAIKYNSNFIQGYATLANAYLMAGLVDESIAASLKCLKIEPDFAVAYNNLAIGYMEKKEYARAAENLDKAEELGYEVSAELRKEIEEHR